MNAIAKITLDAGPAPEAEVAPTGLALLRVPFPAHQISKLPKGGVTLDYVGHAALTDRLLDADPQWSWEPVADPVSHGLPFAPGGMWIRLTVCGVTRYGFGHPDGKSGGNAVKEVIGDALRNAAMRFGAALDLWHKGELHAAENEAPTASAEDMALNMLRGCGNKAMLQDAWNSNKAGWKGLLPKESFAKLIGEVSGLVEKFNAEDRKPEPKPVETFDISDDDIPY